MSTIKEFVASGREFVLTDEAAPAILHKPQTLYKWACYGNGPIQPVRIGRRLLWRVSDLARLVGEA
ncbi:helix-turn-helix domain-containing protein [Crenobacter intestini]|uniref:Helix-turn-helix domain-containing protein n=1 Tax=Crenobacter intestini TaxID=2563443 RepID=A0A4T0V1M2_9NEIS|nr:helix-turn-helix domain-containing protein [Crenobacter intestini]